MNRNLRPRCSDGMTLIELLGVIVVFAIIWGFVFPGTDAVRRNSLRRKAAADAGSLASAVLSYRDVYGRWPLNPTNSEDMVYLAEESDSADMSACVTASQTDLISALSHTNKVWNPDSVHFIEIDADDISGGYFVDPWSTTNNPCAYIVAVDSNGDGWIGKVNPVSSGRNNIGGITVSRSGSAYSHQIPPVKSQVYVFSWTCGDSEKVEVK